MSTDTLGDMLTRIKNAAMVGHPTVAATHSKLNERVAEILKEEGFLDAIGVVEEGVRKTLNLTIRYSGERRERKPVVSELKRISKPGRRVYCATTEIPRVLSGIGIAVIRPAGQAPRCGRRSAVPRLLKGS
jgi:small subunit ribosomal protein S8